MEKKYFERNIDELGRITIPNEIMEELGLKANGELLAVSLIDGEIALYPVKGERCVICHKHDVGKLYDVGGELVCGTCIIAIDNNELSSESNLLSDIRKIDELGRVVLPIADRKVLKLEPNNKVFIYVDDGGIFVKPAVSCYFCNSDKSLMQIGNNHFCSECMETISNLAKEIS